MPGHAFIEEQQLRNRHIAEIYPHGFKGCTDCGARAEEKCLHKSKPGVELKNPHKGRRFRAGFGFEQWKKEQAEKS